MQRRHDPDPLAAFDTLFIAALFSAQGICWLSIGLLLGWVWWGPAV